MKATTTLSASCKALLLPSLFLLISGVLRAQVSLTDLTPYTQNFSSLTQSTTGTTWNDNATLTGWYVDNGPTTTIKASTGTDVTDGLKSYGSSSSSDRALGCVTSSATGNFYYGLRLKNYTGKVIRDLNVSYRLETWRTLDHKKTDFRFSYRKATSVNNLTTGTWINYGNLDVNVAKCTSTGAVNGNNSPYYYTVSALLADLELAPGEEIMLRWNDLDNNSIYLGIDDVTVTPLNTERVYYSKAAGNLHSTSTWTVNADGSDGDAPANFTGSYQKFVLLNSTTPTLTANWTVSGESSKVVVGNNIAAVNFTIPTTFTFTGTTDVTNNATLTVNNATLPTLGTLGLTSTVTYNSSAVQYLTASEYGNLVITGSGTKKLGANTKINNRLTLTNKNLELENYNLELGSGATITGADSTGYIVTKGTGKLRRQVANNNTEVTFPVGTDVYAPVKIKQALTATTDIFSVKATDGIYDYYLNNEPVGEAFTSSVVNHTWIVDEDVIGNSNVTLSVRWKRTKATSDFALAAARLNHFKDGWDDASLATYQKTGSYYEISRANITSFSPFGVFSGMSGGGGMGVLPVKLISFKATRENNAVICKWATAQELNNAGFTVERSHDGKTFTSIGSVKGVGTTSQTTTYTFTDNKAPAGVTYYRLRQTDFDGKIDYSGISIITAKPEINVFTLYPNPASGMRYLQTNTALTGTVKFIVTNAKGSVLTQQEAQPEFLKGGFPIDLSGQPKGLYFIRIITDSETTVLRMVQN